MSSKRQVILMALAAAFVASGCTRNARLADRRLRDVRVRTVTYEGIELGPQADPRDVAYVLLKAVRDDVKAGKDMGLREMALDRQYGVCDPDFIYDRYLDAYKTRANQTRDEWVSQYVRNWAPTLGHYVDQFAFGRDEAAGMMLVTENLSKTEDWPGEAVLIELPLADPAGEPGAAVLAQIRLHKTKEGYWRVFQVGFSRKRPRVYEQTIPATTQPTPDVGPAS